MPRSDGIAERTPKRHRFTGCSSGRTSALILGLRDGREGAIQRGNVPLTRYVIASILSSVRARLTAALQASAQAKFELGVAVSLFNWPALTLAVQNQWGGADSEGKREWFAGAVSDLFVTRPDTDLEDVETVLLQVMLDEFEINVDDDTALDVAKQIMRLRQATLKGDFSEVDALYNAWSAKKDKDRNDVSIFRRLDRGDDADDTDWDSDDDDEEDEDEDVEMNDIVPPSRPKAEKAVPEVDEDGFTKVVGKRKA